MSKHRTLPLELHPALVEHARQRAESARNRIADRITTVAELDPRPEVAHALLERFDMGAEAVRNRD